MTLLREHAQSSSLRLVTISLGGQTLIVGNVARDIGSVSVVVDTGLEFHAWKDLRIMSPAAKKLRTTTKNQKSLIKRDLDMDM